MQREKGVMKFMKKKLLTFGLILALACGNAVSMVPGKDMQAVSEQKSGTSISQAVKDGNTDTGELSGVHKKSAPEEFKVRTNRMLARADQDAVKDLTTIDGKFNYVIGKDQTVEITNYNENESSVKIPDQIAGKKVTKIGRGAFYEHGNLTNVSLPATIKELADGAFADCYELTAITLPEALESIGDYAFQNTKITRIKLPAKVKSIGILLTTGNDQFTGFDVATSNTSFSSDNGVLFSKDKKSLINYPTGKPDATYVVPASVTVIKSSSFQNCQNLKQVRLGAGVREIEDWAFAMSGLTSFTLPATVTKVGDGPLNSCEDLASIDIVNTQLKTLPYRFAYECSGLKSVKMTGRLKKIDNQAFTYCNELENIIFNQGLQEIGVASFAECTALRNVTLPEGLKTIAYQAFAYDTNLANINIPSSVEEIYGYAFDDCPVLDFVKKRAAEIPLVNIDVSESVFIKAQTLRLTGTADYTQAYKVLELVNQERKKQGSQPLKMDKTLLATAMQRAAETSVSWSHDRPCGLDCFSASNKMSGENIAAGQTSAKDVMYSWMHSEGHRANILSSNFQSIGIGCFYQNGSIYWVQCFGSGTAENVSQAPKNAKKQFSVYATNEYVPKANDYDNKQGFKLLTGQTKQIKMYVAGDWSYADLDADSFNWSSSNSQVATVSATGVIKALKEGSAIISVKNKTMPSAVTKVKVVVSVPQYKVTLNANGGKITKKSVSIKKNSTFGSLPVPSRRGYAFTGWYTAKSGGTKVKSTNKVTKNQTLYAHWKLVKYTIQYQLNKGKNSRKNPTAYYVTSKTITLQNPTRKGYIFRGWYSDSKYKHRVTKITAKSTGKKILYAKWVRR